MNVMITGCAGFIGSHAADYFLSKGVNVVGLDSLTYAADMKNLSNALKNKNFKFIKEDICNTDEVIRICQENSISWIFNFAAETHVDNSIVSDSEFIRTNIIGVKSLLDVCKMLNTKLFQISTDEVYGPITSGSFSEDDKLSPQNPYAATKAAAEHIILSYSNTHQIKFIIVRPANNFGPRQHEEKLLPTIIRSLKSNRKIPLYGDGKNIRDWLFVEDNVKIIYEIWDRSPINEVYNISLSNEKTNIEIIRSVLSIFEREFEENVDFVKDRLGHDFRYSISNKKMSDLGIMKIYWIP